MKLYFNIIFTTVVILFLSCISGCDSSLKLREKNVSDDTYVESYCEISTSKITDESTTSISKIYVYITGCVKLPGVYVLPYGSRIIDVLNMAGGFSECANSTCVNLASQVVDGMHIHIYSVDEETDEQFAYQNQMYTDEENTDRILVNINTATKEELMSLSGIGDSKAQKIITYREEHGKFKNIEEIMNVPGIKNAAYESIKDFICVN